EQGILPVRRREVRGGGRASRSRRLPLPQVPKIFGPPFRLHRRAAIGGSDQRRGQGGLVSVVGKGAARLLRCVRLVALLGPFVQGLDRHRHGRIRHAHRHAAPRAYLCRGQGRLLRDRGRSGAVSHRSLGSRDL
ncbi:MAG: Gfa-like protein, partial [uncultured Sphingosinicella sp.]